ncbi:MAG: hypothetical protein COW03_11650 [Cytophagales bacterium CG12_big_fil_rev_8_21_14_0_65_40_12]|nr:MAG: hypothetical protein COW03_11650 [Cytophagales bacterium CG12_big_fil_rev_8_21_14_0_65_40_12]PIW04957.1 MAG: hypothetical protein COW40_06745 [Cytophagales bacterium CG17_big_fil_post_rev_8_21_14_2_50_40_13]
MSIEENATNLLIALYNKENEAGRRAYEGHEVSSLIELTPDDINDAVEFLADRDLIERLNWMGTHPYMFGQIELNAKGRHIYQELLKSENVTDSRKAESDIVAKQPLAAGSPYGFSDEDWEYTQMKINDSQKLIVVMGYQFESEYYNSEKLTSAIKNQFENVLRKWNSDPKTNKFELDFVKLGAGYGEHLFNQIARDIISSDIAIFETSDLNPNVMLELGVALTWGKRVLPIKLKGQKKPPSDISGQTWADYLNDGEFVNENHDEQLYRMIERAIQKKTKGM